MFKKKSVLSFWSFNKKQRNQSMMYIQKLHMPSNCYIKQNDIKQSISTALKHWPAPPAVGLQKQKKNVPKKRNKIEKNLFTFILKNDYQ